MGAGITFLRALVLLDGRERRDGRVAGSCFCYFSQDLALLILRGQIFECLERWIQLVGEFVQEYWVSACCDHSVHEKFGSLDAGEVGIIRLFA